MRLTSRSWRYLIPLPLLPAVLFALAALYADGQVAAPETGSCVETRGDSADRAELLLQLVRTEELQRQAQHQVDALLQ